jgi:SAM-dependent methyltransferase
MKNYQNEVEKNEIPEHVRRNRIAWDRFATDYAEPGRRAWQAKEPYWGIWSIPEKEARLLPEKVEGLDVIELGCGTAYVSAWLARRGASVTGIDNSAEQLKTARALQAEHDLYFPLIHGNAENVPLPDSSFDLAISEYGASIWCDPYRWIPEASRLLRPGGQLIFLVNGAILILCMNDDENIPATSQLLRDYFGMNRFEFPDGDSVEFHLGYGDWIRLLRSSNFEIEDLKELRPPEGATTGYPFVKLDWARRWPSEEVWVVRKAFPRRKTRY